MADLWVYGNSLEQCISLGRHALTSTLVRYPSLVYSIVLSQPIQALLDALAGTVESREHAGVPPVPAVEFLVERAGDLLGDVRGALGP